MHMLIIIGRSEIRTIRRKRQGQYFTFMTLITSEPPAIANFPAMYLLVYIARNDYLVLGRPGQRLNCSPVTNILFHTYARDFPDRNKLILSCYSYLLAIGRPGQRLERIDEACTCQNQFVRKS